MAESQQGIPAGASAVCAVYEEPAATVVKAAVGDHITPHRGDQKLFWDRSNWRSLCKQCHDKKTRAEDNNPTYTY